MSILGVCMRFDVEGLEIRTESIQDAIAHPTSTFSAELTDEDTEGGSITTGTAGGALVTKTVTTTVATFPRDTTANSFVEVGFDAVRVGEDGDEAVDCGR